MDADTIQLLGNAGDAGVFQQHQYSGIVTVIHSHGSADHTILLHQPFCMPLLNLSDAVKGSIALPLGPQGVAEE